MAGGEFRFGTDSIYMARHQHRPPESTSAKIWITWLHYGCVSGPIASLFNTIAVFRRGKLGLDDCQAFDFAPHLIGRRTYWNEMLASIGLRIDGDEIIRITPR